MLEKRSMYRDEDTNCMTGTAFIICHSDQWDVICNWWVKKERSLDYATSNIYKKKITTGSLPLNPLWRNKLDVETNSEIWNITIGYPLSLSFQNSRKIMTLLMSIPTHTISKDQLIQTKTWSAYPHIFALQKTVPQSKEKTLKENRDTLLTQRPTGAHSEDNWESVLNLSSISLTNSEKSLLAKGLNFWILTVKRFSITWITSPTEIMKTR